MLLILLKKQMSQLLNVRSSGLIIGFDLTNASNRDILVKRLYNNGLICNSTGEKERLKGSYLRKA